MQRTLTVVQSALFAALLAVCAWIAVPTAVPFTLQTFGVYLTLLLLGGRQGSLVVAVYLLLGAVGLPVFAGGRGGLAVLCGVTGGYLCGLLLIALLYWVTKAHTASRYMRVVVLAVGQLLCYLGGTVWFSVLSGDRLGVAFVTCVLPFLLPDAVKLGVAFWLAPRLAKVGKI